MNDDRGESISLLEPLLVGESSPKRGILADLALELASRASGFYRSLPDGISKALADLVRSMNCYYSNLIEGHNTHPIDIERALNSDYSDNLQKRNLQLEARAHIETQKWIDEEGLRDKATTIQGILECHRRFCGSLPADLLWVENPESKERIKVIPGEFRNRDVVVGRHVAISSGAIPRFLGRFENYFSKMGKVDSIIAAATAHHRLLWIHPFLDGNGRVARLMSYAILKDALKTGGTWSIARGLARREKEYKQHLANCDLPRRNDLDGRGHLSEEALAEFVKFFLEICIDQVSYMEQLVQPNRLRDRILLWCEEEIRHGHLPSRSNAVLEGVLFRGELPRGEVQTLLNTSERNARRVTSTLIEQSVLTSSSSRAPLRLNFPASLSSRWLPGLFPELPNDT